MIRSATISLIVWFLSVTLPSALEARVVRLVVEHTRPYAAGRNFGSVGPFVWIEGTAYMEVNPRDPLNAVIVNLDKAPRNANGHVEFSARFFIIKPVDMSRGNHKIVYGINNRGNVNELRHLQFPFAGDPLGPGDGLIFRLGYTFVDVGWAGDIVSAGTRLGAKLPVAVQADGRPIVAPIRIEYDRYDQAWSYTTPLKGNDQFVSYEAADTNPAHSTLTVRDSVRGPKTTISSDRWAFGRCEKGEAALTPTTLDLCLFDGFQLNRIYELIYPAQNPWVMGLGYAVTRDVASFLRYDAHDAAGARNPLAQSTATVGIRRVYATGSSSTGMYLRDFLYLGFNEDEAHRKAFDGVSMLVPGTHRLFANVEYADPNIYSRQDDHHDFTSLSYLPFTYGVTTDPISGIRDGILKRPATDPFVFQTDTANEFWQMNASLNVADGRGHSLPITDNVRLYFLPSYSHTGGSGVAQFPMTKGGTLALGGACEYVTNGGRGIGTERALLVALDDWVDRGIAPPPSNYPDVRKGELMTLQEATKAFPAIPGVKFPTVLNELTLMDFGPRFSSTGGWLSKLPPAQGKPYQILIPKPDPDGLDVGGIRIVDITAPVGANTGWNLRGTDLCGLSGSFFPFAVTKAEREATGDPRLSLEERYKDHAGFVKAVEAAAARLVKERFLLDEDAKTMIQLAEKSTILRERAAP